MNVGISDIYICVKCVLQELFSNIDQGQDKLQATIGKGEIVLPETSNQGQDLIKEELSMLTTEFEGFVADGDDLKNNLGKILITQESVVQVI